MWRSGQILDIVFVSLFVNHLCVSKGNCHLKMYTYFSIYSAGNSVGISKIRKGAYVGRVSATYQILNRYSCNGEASCCQGSQELRTCSSCSVSKPTDARQTVLIAPGKREEWGRQPRRQLLPQAAGPPCYSDSKRPGATVFVWILGSLTAQFVHSPPGASTTTLGEPGSS